MRNYIIGLFLLGISVFSSFAQVPEYFNYQAVLRNSSGDLVKNTSITVKISLLMASSTGELQYSESHNLSTNNYGQFAVKIGSGTVVSGAFTTIDWSNAIYLKTEVANPAGGVLVDMGTTQLISVPYAFYSKNAGNVENIIITGNESVFTNWDKNTNDDFDGNYTSLSGVPINISEFNNNVGYLTSFSEVDGSVTNEIQDLSLTNNILKITNNSNASEIDLNVYLDDTNTQLTEAQVDVFVSNNGYLTSEADGSVINEIQDINLTGNILKITNNNAATEINLSKYLDDTDTQLTEVQVDSYVSNNGYITNEVDGSVTNEIQDLSLTNNKLKITNNSNSTEIDLSIYLDDTDTQLTEAQVDGFVSNNGYLIGEVDGSVTNEIQTITISNNELSISGGNTITLPGANSEYANVPIYSTSEIVALIPDNGDAIYNSTENLYQIYNGSQWVSFAATCWPQPTLANAGNDQLFDDGSISTTLNANLPNQHHGAGAWSIVNGSGGNINNTNNPISTFSGNKCTEYELKWSISTDCGTSSDNVKINFYQTPTIPDAGEDISFTDGTSQFTLSANTPTANHGTGRWSIISGEGGSFNDVNSPTATFTGSICEDYELSWEIYTDCSSLNDNVLVSFYRSATIAGAGEDIVFRDGTTQVQLSANTPEVNHGTGEWSVVSGIGGSFVNSNNPTTIFNGQIHEKYILHWTISTECENNFDDITVTFAHDEPGSTVTDYDSNVYNTVWIGAQQWMAADLKTRHFSDGTEIPFITDISNDWKLLTETDKACRNYPGEANYVYTWAAAVDGTIGSYSNPSTIQGACPVGWHLPSEAEWNELVDYLGGAEIAGGKLKETGTIFWNAPNTGASNEVGFSAHGGGKILPSGIGDTFKAIAFYWTSSLDYGGNNPICRIIWFNNTEVNEWLDAKNAGLSIRCVKD